MKTKVCTVCQKELPIEDFNWKSKSKQKRRSDCKYCQSNHMKEQYQKKKAYVAQIKAEKGCAKCGEKRDYVLDFHHIDPSQKDDSVARLTSNTTKFEKLEKEINKCVVLCANCHREFHYLISLNSEFSIEEYLNSE